jgi:nitrite reductase/ring-hydroxylating ferredoxin subunit
MTLKLAIENAIEKAAPEIEEVIAVQAAPETASPLLQIEFAPAVTPAAAGSWTTVGALREVGMERVTVKRVEDAQLALLRLGTHLYAYRGCCPACGGSLEGAAIKESELTCANCGDRYDALRAGRGLDRPELHLEPVPLLEGDDGLVRVALPALA